jgi:C_GCAxxG_C_C family probable redox protein
MSCGIAIGDKGTKVAKLKSQYKGWSYEQLSDQIYELAFASQRFSRSCSQSIVAAFYELFEMDDSVVKIATSCTGGHAGLAISTCGALIGGTIVLDYFFGRPFSNVSFKKQMVANIEILSDSMQISSQLHAKFMTEYGSITCSEIQTQLLGRYYYLLDSRDLAQFEHSGGFRNKSPHVIGKTARWVLEIMSNNTNVKHPGVESMFERD